ncbi:MAG: hypothetical protein WB611_25890 [Stellaceae bacterium]
MPWLFAARRLLAGQECEGDVREVAYRLIRYLSVGLLVFLIVVFAYALTENLRVIGPWLERPYLFVFPAIGVIAAPLLAASVRQRPNAPPLLAFAATGADIEAGKVTP